MWDEGVFLCHSRMFRDIQQCCNRTSHCYSPSIHSYDPRVFEENIYCFYSIMKNYCMIATWKIMDPFLDFTLEYGIIQPHFKEVISFPLGTKCIFMSEHSKHCVPYIVTFIVWATILRSMLLSTLIEMFFAQLVVCGRTVSVWIMEINERRNIN